ncbi:unnamed protein product [Pleuronectes platessa]|uniref:Uncharacterized protein n=1 Tax=Pleuronectes platessa TaxID=8262 RepID=A0A9N7YUZ2_PLEPL|nr:unnamed protein product [Pleuronectes platessa]
MPEVEAELEVEGEEEEEENLKQEENVLKEEAFLLHLTWGITIFLFPPLRDLGVSGSALSLLSSCLNGRAYQKVAQVLVQALVISRQDYCNSLLAAPRISPKNMDPITIGDQTLEDVDKFTYLGSVIAVDVEAHRRKGPPLRDRRVPLSVAEGNASRVASRVQTRVQSRIQSPDTRPESLPPTAVPGPLQRPAFRTGDGHRPTVQEKESTPHH